MHEGTCAFSRSRLLQHARHTRIQLGGVAAVDEGRLDALLGYQSRKGLFGRRIAIFCLMGALSGQ